jgi:hypothetical protein
MMSEQGVRPAAAKERDVQYILLIHDDENNQLNDGSAEILAEYGRFSAEAAERGVLRGGQRLRPTSTASTVRVRDGKTMITDGPFAETKEQLGGFYMLDCRDLDEALEFAAKVPSARNGSIEVRPIWER